MGKFIEPDIQAIKLNVRKNFQLAGTEVTASAAELNIMDGVTSTASELNILDGVTATAVEINKLAGVTAGTTTASKSLVVDANKALDFLALGGVAPSAAALVLGIGDAATRATTSTPNKNFIEMRAENTAGSGDNRGFYNRLYLGGAGGGGESLRTFTTVDDVAASTAHGAHISLNFNATGSITGQGIAMRGTLHIPDVAMSGGTYAAVQAEIFADGSTSDISGTTAHAVWRTVVGGDAAGAATVATYEDMVIPAASIGSGKLVDTAITTHTPYGGLPIDINGTTRWIALVSA